MASVESSTQAAAQSGPGQEEILSASQSGAGSTAGPSLGSGEAPAARESGPVAAVLGSGVFGPAASAARVVHMENEPPTPAPHGGLTPDMQEVIDVWSQAGVPDPLMRYLGVDLFP